MIQHILLWSYREGLDEEERIRLEGELTRLPERVSSLRKLEWGPVVGGRNQSFTHCFVMHFDSMEGLQEYATHPEHVAFATPFRNACSAQVVVDFRAELVLSS
jgi:hypothetical protein